MNDRYLYRAKRTDNGACVDGASVHSVYKINDICVGKYGSEVGMHQVDESTICQCTGLRDKNGKLIFENDIVKRVDRRNDRHIFREQPSMNCKVVWTYNYGFDTLPSCGYFDKSDGLECEVIGNFFDEGSENIGKGAEEN